MATPKQNRGARRRWPTAAETKPDAEQMLAKFAGLSGGRLYQALISDSEPWGVEHIAAAAGRSVSRIHRFVTNWIDTDRDPRVVPGDKVFVRPDGWIGGKPWWQAGRARKWLIQNGFVDRDTGRSKPYVPIGRRAGATDLRPRSYHATTRTVLSAVSGPILARYRALIKQGMTDRQARAALRAEFGLSVDQLRRRLNAALAAESAAPPEVDNADLLGCYRRLVDRYRAGGASHPQADDKARTDLAAESGLTRRQLAARIIAAQAELGAAVPAAEVAAAYRQLVAAGQTDQQARAELRRRYPTLTTAQIRRRVRESADDQELEPAA